MPSLVGQLTQFCFKHLWVNAESDHGSEVHVAADSGWAVVDECRHIWGRVGSFDIGEAS